MGWGDLEPDGHIDHLYRHPAIDRAGIGSIVLDHLIDLAIDRSIGQLCVEASELARPLFERKQFNLIRRQDFELRGVMIHHYLMKRVFT